MSEIIPPPSSTTEYYRPIEVFVVQPRKPRYWLHALLLLATVFTTLVVGARTEYNFQHNWPAFYLGDGALDYFPVQWSLQSGHLLLGVPFSFALMSILLAHEMGHYLYCRYYGVGVTLPFFIPFPTLAGTMGAFILIRSPIRNRANLFDIGIAGPIAGFVVAVAVLFFALGLSRVVPGIPSDDTVTANYPLIFSVVHLALTKMGLAKGTAGLPLGQVLMHPTATAAWVGMLATSLNLLPGGQLDGGHIVFSLSPRAHRAVTQASIVGLLPLAYYCWAGWLLWAVVLRLTGMRHPMVPELPGIDVGRRVLGVLALLMLVLTFTPAPIAHSSMKEMVPGIVQSIRQLIEALIATLRHRSG